MIDEHVYALYNFRRVTAEPQTFQIAIVGEAMQ